MIGSGLAVSVLAKEARVGAELRYWGHCGAISMVWPAHYPPALPAGVPFFILNASAMKTHLFSAITAACGLIGCLLVGSAGSAQAQSAYSFHATPTTPTDYLVNSGAGCVGCQVLNPALAADLSSTTAATMSTPLGLGGGTYLRLRLRLTATVPGGSVAGVVVGSNRLLDLVTLSRVRLRTFLGNTVVQTKSGANAVEVKVTGANRYVIEFKTSNGAGFNFDRVELGLGGLSDAASTLDVFYAYGIPEGTTPLGPAFTSTFPAPSNGNEYQASTTGICVLCGVVNPARAADENLGTNNYATVQTTIGALGSTRLRLQLNGVAPAGSDAGIVISTGSLIDLNVLSTLTIRTYVRDINNNLVLQETAVGGSLLQLNLLTGNRYVISFKSTLPFEYVELSVGGLATVLNTVRVYYAFGAPAAEDPLPVTLTSFGARARAGGGVQLTWTTASEYNSATFEVERATQPKAGFVSVGEPVPGAGTSAAPHRYALLDGTAPAGTLYYRLRQRDTDGKVHYSDVATVRATAPTGPPLSVWPNPAHDRLTIRYTGAAEALSRPLPGAAVPQVVISNMLGQTVARHELTGPETSIVISTLAPGRYLARLVGETGPGVAVLVAGR